MCRAAGSAGRAAAASNRPVRRKRGRRNHDARRQPGRSAGPIGHANRAGRYGRRSSRHSESACYYGADAVVFDAGNRPDRTARRLWQTADQRLFVTTPDTAAIIAAFATIRLLTEPGPAEPLRLLVNAAESAASGVEAHRRLALACRRFLGMTLTDGGCVPLDPEVPKAAWASQPFVLTAPNCAASRSLGRLVNLVNSQCLAKPQAAVLHTS